MVNPTPALLFHCCPGVVPVGLAGQAAVVVTGITVVVALVVGAAVVLDGNSIHRLASRCVVVFVVVVCTPPHAPWFG